MLVSTYDHINGMDMVRKQICLAVRNFDTSDPWSGERCFDSKEERKEEDKKERKRSRRTGSGNRVGGWKLMDDIDLILTGVYRSQGKATKAYGTP